jgi:membrane-associated phospholipid phosphatase
VIEREFAVRASRSIHHLALTRLCVLLVGLLVCQRARADAAKEAGRLEWNPAWPKFRTSEYAITGLAGAASLGVFFLVSSPEKPHWVGGILLDDTLRAELRLRTPEQRDAARTASNWTALSTVVWAVGVDSIVVPIARSKAEVAQQLVSMDAEAFAVSTLITNTMFKIVGRARPPYEACQRDPNFDPLCRSGATASFPSGHTNIAFTAAGLSCAHHLHLALYGSTLADTLACASTISLAAATGSLRVLGDRHYATDVWLGAIVGFAVGYGMPTLLHYGKASNSAQTSQALQPAPAGFPLGPTISGTF